MSTQDTKNNGKEETSTSNVLTMFPASKNFPLEQYPELNIPDFDDERFDNEEIEIEEESDYSSLEAFMNRNRPNVNSSPEDLLIERINKQIDTIKEAKERIKFYLDELSVFLGH